jgi:ATP-dependent Clp protease ATP-binding subunit ClpA
MANHSRQPMPRERLRFNRAPATRHGCVPRWGLTFMPIFRAIRDALFGGPPCIPPETWTPEVHRVFSAAADAAKRMKHDFLAPEHLLLGLLSCRGNTVCRVLSGAGFDVDELHAAAEARASDLQRDHCGPTSELSEVLRQAVGRERRRLGHHYGGTEALFLGLLACDVSGAQWLCAHGLDYSRAQNLLHPKTDVRAQEETAQPAALGNDAPPGSLPTSGNHSEQDQLSSDRRDRERFEKLFTRAAREVMRYAIEYAEESHHEVVGADHLLLSLLRCAKAGTVDWPESSSIAVSEVESEIAENHRNMSGAVTKVRFSSRVSRIIHRASHEPILMSGHSAGPEHFLKALLEEESGPVHDFLTAKGVAKQKT